jgi:HTH-type transcriptional regulator/antitoxin HigA
MGTPSYPKLLQQVQPEVIGDAKAHRRALRVIDSLMKKARLTKAEGKLLDLLAKLVDDYEETIYPTPNVPPAEILAHLLEARGGSQAELARQTGVARSTISEVLKGKRRLSVDNAFRLANFFHVDATLFLTSS